MIVGLGTAGCPLARYLTEDMKTSVIVLEAGLDQETNPLVTSTVMTGNTTLAPANSNVPVANEPSLNFVYTADQGEVILPNRLPYTYTVGRMWGGTSAHNTMIAVRGAPTEYDQWGAIDSR